MDTIIGIGEAGCNLANCFAKYPQYSIYKIDTDIEGRQCMAIEAQTTPEKYEEFALSTNLRSRTEKFLKDVKGEVLFIVSGAGKISGCTLAILGQIKHCDISILYIKPDVSLLGGTGLLQERAVFGILQEYARSGLFKRVWISHNPSLESVYGDVPVIGYYDKLNELIVSTMHMLNVFNNSKPVMGENFEPNEISRLSTLGIISMEEMLFFPLNNVTEKVYYYAINEEQLKTDGTLYKKITQEIKQKREQGLKVSYRIYATSYEDNYCYCVAHTHFIQENE